MRARPVAVAGTRRPSWLRRVWLLAQAVLYALTAWAVIRGAAATTRPITPTDLDAPGSPPGLRGIVLVVGLVLVVIGAALLLGSVRPPDRRNLLGAPGRLPAAGQLLGRIGRPARGIAFLLPGAIIAAEALAYRPGSFGRVTEDVRVALQAPWGRLLLGLLAAGLIAFAAYELAAAVYRREPVTLDAPRRWAPVGRH
jgi:hypothetical protein